MTTTLQELDEVLARGDIHEMHQFLRDEHEEIRAALELQAKQGWQPIETAPKDGTTIDVWRDEQRETVYWGFPPHECGEMGEYCDSEWHGIKHPGWICSLFGEFVGSKHNPFTHWMPLPAPPAQGEQG